LQANNLNNISGSSIHKLFQCYLYRN